MIRFARYLLVAALMVSIGAQWAVLQSVAWMGMAVSYSLEAGSVTAGLSKTFDGDHPCKLCHAVSEGQKSEKKDPLKKSEQKNKQELFASEGRAIVISVPASISLPAAADEVAFSRSLEPPSPPPRCA